MNPKFICHPDFADVEIIDIFRKELSPKPQYDHPEHLKNRHVIFRNKFEPKKDCQMYISDKECRGLKQMYCLKENCVFYKPLKKVEE